MKEAFKKRKREIEREEQEFENKAGEEDEISDTDSVLEAIEHRASCSDSDDHVQREAQKRELFRSRPRRY
ncbi:hypothetical protein FHG87_012108 [Trinorchestia longiramus]|nr:hypothetical protein FHG87_012108 [Trinorchestia longiramus]